MEWQPISTAPRDGTTIIACRASRWTSEQRVAAVWFQPEFDTFIEGCREMQMHNGYRFGDGSTRKLHSPEIPGVTHWLCALPAVPRDSGSDRQAETACPAPGEASQSGGAEGGASPTPSNPSLDGHQS